MPFLKYIINGYKLNGICLLSIRHLLLQKSVFILTSYLTAHSIY